MKKMMLMNSGLVLVLVGEVFMCLIIVEQINVNCGGVLLCCQVVVWNIDEEVCIVEVVFSLEELVLCWFGDEVFDYLSGVMFEI